MSVLAAAGFSTAPLWYATRGTAVVGFVLLSFATVLGIGATQRAMASRAWPRFATQDLHRNISLLAIVFVAVHVVTTLLDTYVRISWWTIVVPGVSSYRAFWVALGTIAFDLLLLVIGTSLARHRMPARAWRGVHLAAYALWPLALLHFLKTGTDAAHGRWGMWLALFALFAVAGAVAVRLGTSNRPIRVRSVAGSPR